MNFLDYLDWRGDITFTERDLNEVDNLIFSTLSYLKMDGLIPWDNKAQISVKDLYDICMAEGVDTSEMPCDPMPLLKKAADTDRFRDVKLAWYSGIYDSDICVQFAAVTFRYAEGRSYIAFRGTDNTLTGWKEDCNFSYITSTPGQIAAAEYINSIAAMCEDLFVVGGHSKGGNLAAYAAAFCNKDILDTRIVQVFSNDGPGFNSEIVETDNYNSILKKTKKIIPESSIVGILLSSKAKRKVIVSDARGINQHNPYSWSVLGTEFEEYNGRNIAGVLMDETLSSWISSLDSKEKQLIIESFFDAMESSGAETLRDVKTQKTASAAAIIRSVLNIDTGSKKELAASFAKLFTAGKEALKTGAENELAGIIKQLKDAADPKNDTTTG